MKAQIIQRLLGDKHITVEEAMVLIKEEKEIKVVIEKDQNSLFQQFPINPLPFPPPLDPPYKVTCSDNNTTLQKTKIGDYEIDIFSDQT